MLNNLRFNKILWLICAGLTLIAAVWGLFDNAGLYRDLMPIGFVAAQYAQDILTILVVAVIVWLTIETKENSVKEPIIILGILGAIAYLYAIFSIERVYNSAYLLYLAILSATFYTIVYTMSSFKEEVISRINVPNSVKYSTAVFAVLIAILFTFLWVSALLPLMKTHNQIQNLYSIYFLDLVFIMPAFVITSVQTFMKKQLGYVLIPAMLILGIFVIFPLGLGELAKPYFNLVPDYKSMTMSFVMSGMFVAASAVQLFTMKVNK